MTDIFTKKKRSAIMSRVHGVDTKPEKAVRNTLNLLGKKYRAHAKELPGKPDIVLDEDRVVLFVNGCFWHGHLRCRRARLPKENTKFWKEKLEGNRRRDQRVTYELRRDGWSVLTLWTCKEPTAEYVAKRLMKVGVSSSRGSRRGRHCKES